MRAIADVLACPCAWLAPGDASAVIISSRIRLARNVREAPFPDWAGPERRAAFWKRVRPRIERLTSLDGAYAFAMDALEDVDAQILFERRLVSKDLLGREGAGVIVSSDEHLALMVNEEDHFRMQCMYPGLRLREAWARVNRLDDELERLEGYAFSPQWGYLTACPTNLGTALRAGVMVHVPGLVFSGDMRPIINGLGKIGLAVRGLWGEGTDATGNMFQVSNQMSMGWTEDALVERLERIVREIEAQERHARARLLESKPHVLRDQVGRAFGVLAHAHVLSSKEALDLLSALRLGHDLGMVNVTDRRALDELVLQVQPAHLQKAVGRALRSGERDIARATLVRDRLNKARIVKRRGRIKRKEEGT